MELTYRLYSGLQMLLGAGGVFGAALLFAGFGPMVAPGVELAAQNVLAGSLSLGVAVGSWYLFGRLRIGRWHGVGEQAGLTPVRSSSVPARLKSIVGGGSAVTPLPPLEGTVDGRTVRAETYAVSKSGESSGTKNYTVVEAELDGPTDMSLVVMPATDTGGATVDLLPGDLETAAVDDEFAMVGRGSTEYTRQILSDRSRSALLDLEDPVGVFVGDPTDAMLDALPDEMGMAMSFVADKFETELREHPANDADTVSMNDSGLLLEAGELQRRTTAVAAIANEVERVDYEHAEPAET